MKNYIRIIDDDMIFLKTSGNLDFFQYTHIITYINDLVTIKSLYDHKANLKFT